MPEATKVKEARHSGTHKEIEAKKAAKKAAKAAKAEAAAPAVVEKAARNSWQERQREAEAAPAIVEKASRSSWQERKRGAEAVPAVVEKAARKREAEAEAPPTDAATAKAAKRAKKAAKEAAKAEAPVVAKAAAAAEEDQPMKIHRKPPTPTTLEDISLPCIDCSQEFTFTVGEQEFFKQKGFGYAKTRCRACADAKKARFGEGGGGKGAGKGAGKGGGKGGGGDGSAAGPTMCYNCGGGGHMSRECTQPKKAMACYT